MLFPSRVGCVVTLSSSCKILGQLCDVCFSHSNTKFLNSETPLQPCFWLVDLGARLVALLSFSF